MGRDSWVIGRNADAPGGGSLLSLMNEKRGRRWLGLC